MDNYTQPKLNKHNDKKWFIWYTYRVPKHLEKQYPRGWKQFKVYLGINRIPLQDREKAAIGIIAEVALSLRNGWLKPFDVIDEVVAQVKSAEKPPERSELTASEAFKLFIQSRVDRKLDNSSVVAYQGTVDWLTLGLGTIPVGEIKYTDVSAVITKTASEPARLWGATTINKEWGFAQTVFNWLAREDYVIKNPIQGKVDKLPTSKTKHKWYDKDTARQVKKAILESSTPWLINVCQFTYETLIRSKKELMNIKCGDIDLSLHRIAFRKEWTKNSQDQFREYPDSFHKLIVEMGVETINPDWYIFGKGGVPGPEQCGHNYFSLAWAKIRDEIRLSDEYTIYGWKHTAIVHDMMKGVDGYGISHRARHSDPKTTDDYKRDYDITLNKVYEPGDLVF